MTSMSRMTPLTLLMANFDDDAMRTDGERVRDDCEGAPLIIWAVGRDEVAGLMRRIAIQPDEPLLERREDLDFWVFRRLEYELRHWNSRSKDSFRILHTENGWIDAPIDHVVGIGGDAVVQSGAAAATQTPPPRYGPVAVMEVAVSFHGKSLKALDGSEPAILGRFTRISSVRKVSLY